MIQPLPSLTTASQLTETTIYYSICIIWNEAVYSCALSSKKWWRLFSASIKRWGMCWLLNSVCRHTSPCSAAGGQAGDSPHYPLPKILSGSSHFSLKLITFNKTGTMLLDHCEQTCHPLCQPVFPTACPCLLVFPPVKDSKSSPSEKQQPLDFFFFFDTQMTGFERVCFH